MLTHNVSSVNILTSCTSTQPFPFLAEVISMMFMSCIRTGNRKISASTSRLLSLLLGIRFCCFGALDDAVGELFPS